MQLTATGLGHRSPGQPMLFRGMDIALRPGELTALVGPSGSGKTTLLTLLAGWEDPSEGSIDREDIGRIAWVAQNPHGTAHRTALDHVVLPLLARGYRRLHAEPVAHDLLARFGLEDTAYRLFRYLSGGEAGRLMLACAVAAEPDLLLVDEPTAQLDPANAAGVIAVISGLASASRIVVVATHDLRVRDACHNVIDLAAIPAADVDAGAHSVGGQQ